jgi:hypothetical protein
MTTEIIVDQKHDTIVVDDTPENTILVENTEITTIISSAEQGPPGPPGIATINEAQDVDVSNLGEGSILIYSPSNEKWVASKLLENQSVESGHY